VESAARGIAAYDAIPDFGLLYDSVPLYAARKDIAFYVEEAARSPGPVLEVGCGTGRILLPIARAGRTIAGLDSSALMLARCRERVAAEPALVEKERVTLHHADMCEFDLGVTFPLVIAPFRVMQHLTQVADQLRFLDAVRRHLAPPPGGRLVFDVFNPNFKALVGADGAEHEDTPEQRLPDGRTLRRTARVKQVRWADQVSEVELIYYVAPRPGAPPDRFVQGFEMRWYLPVELTHLLARAGFRISAMYGDFTRTPLVDGAPEQVVCAEPA
jgi:SAM-dependent methyltransferase